MGNESKSEMERNGNNRSRNNRNGNGGNMWVYAWREGMCLFAMLFVIAFLDVIGISISYTTGKHMTKRTMTLATQEFRDHFFSEELRQNESLSSACKQALQNVEKEALYFPVPKSDVDKSLQVSFVDTWLMERNYGGKRAHEGTDIMASENKRGLYPVVSVSDGIVKNKGWLEKGGWRIGIISNSGTYYYYAHLDSYSNLKIGDNVRAGELLGYMGDSGYGAEGTVGQFPVHLHFGIYFYEDGKEISVNPYEVLLFLENKKLIYSYF